MICLAKHGNSIESRFDCVQCSNHPNALRLRLLRSNHVRVDLSCWKTQVYNHVSKDRVKHRIVGYYKGASCHCTSEQSFTRDFGILCNLVLYTSNSTEQKRTSDPTRLLQGA